MTDGGGRHPTRLPAQRLGPHPRGAAPSGARLRAPSGAGPCWAAGRGVRGPRRRQRRGLRIVRGNRHRHPPLTRVLCANRTWTLARKSAFLLRVEGSFHINEVHGLNANFYGKPHKLS